MSLMGQQLEYHRLRAPRKDGQTLIDPPLTRAGELIAGNVALRRQWTGELQGRSLPQLIGEAREQLVAAALDYTRQYRPAHVPAPSAATPILLAGHQPQLFHPGVWFKNFV